MPTHVPGTQEKPAFGAIDRLHHDSFVEPIPAKQIVRILHSRPVVGGRAKQTLALGQDTDLSLLEDPGRMFSLHALSAVDGRILWRTPLARQSYGAPVYAAGLLFVPSTFDFTLKVHPFRRIMQDFQMIERHFRRSIQPEPGGICSIIGGCSCRHASRSREGATCSREAAKAAVVSRASEGAKSVRTDRRLRAFAFSSKRITSASARA